jgi:hypothetical protein
MGGASVRLGPGEAPVLAPFLDFGFYLGPGPTSYVMRTSKAVACTSSTTLAPHTACVDGADPADPTLANRTKTTALGINTGLALGARFRFARPSSRLRLSGELLFRADLIYGQSNSVAAASGKDHSIDFGSTDVFFGPRFNFVGEF